MQCEILFDKIIHIDMKYNYVISYCEIIPFAIYTSLTGIQKEIVFHFQEISKWTYKQIHQDRHKYTSIIYPILFLYKKKLDSILWKNGPGMKSCENSEFLWEYSRKQESCDLGFFKTRNCSWNLFSCSSQVEWLGVSLL